MSSTQIYMDNHSTTRLDPRAFEAMRPYFCEIYGNAGSTSHGFGDDARQAAELARASIAEMIGAQPKDIVFTSGATESNNLALRGIAERHKRRGKHLVSVTTEHKATLDPLARLARREFEVTLLSPPQQGASNAGILDPQRVADSLRDDTILVSVMLANNEVGAIAPLPEIAKLCQQKNVLLHTDATQAVGKIPVDVAKLGIDLMSFSAHKIYGPKGIGALYVRRSAPPVRLEPQIDGGGQENGLRSGTLNVPGIVGFAAALKLCLAEMPEEFARLRRLRARLWSGLNERLDDLQLNGPALDPPDRRLAGNLNVSFAHVDGEALMMSMKELAVSSGSACTSANPEPSHVLRALGLSEDLTRSSLRFGLGRFNTENDVERAIELVFESVQRLRKLSTG